jgi:hypothetical protein
MALHEIHVYGYGVYKFKGSHLVDIYFLLFLLQSLLLYLHAYLLSGLGIGFHNIFG